MSYRRLFFTDFSEGIAFGTPQFVFNGAGCRIGMTFPGNEWPAEACAAAHLMYLKPQAAPALNSSNIADYIAYGIVDAPGAPGPSAPGKYLFTRLTRPHGEPQYQDQRAGDITQFTFAINPKAGYSKSRTIYLRYKLFLPSDLYEQELFNKSVNGSWLNWAQLVFAKTGTINDPPHDDGDLRGQVWTGASGFPAECSITGQVDNVARPRAQAALPGTAYFDRHE